MSKPHQGGANSIHLGLDKLTPFSFSPEDLQALRLYIASTTAKKSGTSGVYCDNSAAINILDM